MSKGRRVLVTGSCGLIGSEVARWFARLGFLITGVDSNHRAIFFGPEGDTSWVLGQLKSEIPDYRHEAIDIRDREAVLTLVEELKPDLIIHTAAQPSHDRAAAIPFLDFEVNGLGTLHLLEAARRSCPESPFIHMSTNKVYGDRPNSLALDELETRWEYAEPAFQHGIAEDFSIDQSKHSLFGASKVAGDIMVQEYGRYFGMPTCCLRGGCLTGPNHSGVELHGFLSYLDQVQCGRPRIQGLRVQRQAGARQHTFRGRSQLHVRILEVAARRGGLQSGRREIITPAPSWKHSVWPRTSPARR